MRILEIEELMEQGVLPLDLRTQLELLLQAINDWPVGVESTEDYIRELALDMGAEVDERSIRRRLIDVDPASEAWIVESLATLIQLFEHGRSEISVPELIAALESELSNEGGCKVG